MYELQEPILAQGKDEEEDESIRLDDAMNKKDGGLMGERRKLDSKPLNVNNPHLSAIVGHSKPIVGHNEIRKRIDKMESNRRRKKVYA